MHRAQSEIVTPGEEEREEGWVLGRRHQGGDVVLGRQDDGVDEPPTVFVELGLPVVNTMSAGLLGPKSLPPELTTALEAACKAITTSAAFEERMTKIGIAISYASSNVYARQLTEDWHSMRALGESVPK